MTGIACVWHVCVCVWKYLDVLHAVPQLNQELLGFGGSVRQAVERLRQLTLWRAQREDVRDEQLYVRIRIPNCAAGTYRD